MTTYDQMLDALYQGPDHRQVAERCATIAARLVAEAEERGRAAQDDAYVQGYMLGRSEGEQAGMNEAARRLLGFVDAARVTKEGEKP